MIHNNLLLVRDNKKLPRVKSSWKSAWEQNFTIVAFFYFVIKGLKFQLNFFVASFFSTLNRNRIPNTVPVPVTSNEYVSDRFRFRNLIYR
jgi:hypothetical protein